MSFFHHPSAGVGAGDSGSPVFKITNNPQQYDVQLLGILWGSSYDGRNFKFVYSSMSGIENELSANSALSTTTNAIGFYSLAVPEGTYNLTATLG